MRLEHEPAVQATIQECIALMEQFENMSLFPAQLLKIESTLATRLTYLLGKKAEYQFRQNSAYWIRRVEQSREAIKARKTSEGKRLAVAMSDHIAITRIQEQIDNENYSVWRYEHLKGFCQGLEKILISIAHRLKDQFSERAVSPKASNW